MITIMVIVIGSKKKKEKRLMQGAFTPILLAGAIFITVLSTSSYQ